MLSCLFCSFLPYLSYLSYPSNVSNLSNHRTYLIHLICLIFPTYPICLIYLCISTSKSGPNMGCFWHLDIKKRFAPQRRALVRHLNFQKRSVTEVFWFWRPNVIRAKTVPFFDMSTTKSAPNMVCFACFEFEMCFVPQRRALFSTTQLPNPRLPRPSLTWSLVTASFIWSLEDAPGCGYR